MGMSSLDASVACTCSCNCQRTTLVPSFSPVFAIHARCDICRAPAHISAHPTDAPDIPLGASGFSRPLTAIYQPTPEELAASERARAQLAEERYQEAMNRWNESVPARFRDARSEHPQLLERLRHVQKGHYGIGSLLITGEVGQGKTWLALSYAYEILRRKIMRPSEIVFGTEADLLASIGNAPFAEVDQRLRRLTQGRYRLIIVDDVGRANWLKEDARPAIFWNVINEQYKNKGLVVLTTNIDRREELESYIGKASFDRLAAMTGKGEYKNEEEMQGGRSTPHGIIVLKAAQGQASKRRLQTRLENDQALADS